VRDHLGRVGRDRRSKRGGNHQCKTKHFHIISPSSERPVRAAITTSTILDNSCLETMKDE
jgi:hypothetical protein